MPTFEITAPDGRVFEVTGPDGSTQEQALAQVQAQYKPQEPSALGKIASGFLKFGPAGAATEIARGTVEGIDTLAQKAGGTATDVAAKVAPPEVAAAIGTAAQIAPTLLLGPVGAPAMTGTARTLMQSALKPNAAARVSGDAAKAIDTMLEEGITMSQAGAAKLRGLIDRLVTDVARQIKAAPDAMVDKAHAASELYETLLKFRKQVNPGADVKAIEKSWEEFSNLVGAKIPVAEAQELKQGTYRVLADKYVKGGTPAVENEASVQAQMAQARGLRKGIEEVVPGVKAPNERSSAAINALELMEGRMGTAGNRDIAGIAWIAQNPVAAAGMLADRSPAFKSALARFIHGFRNAAGPAAATTYYADEQK